MPLTVGRLDTQIASSVWGAVWGRPLWFVDLLVIFVFLVFQALSFVGAPKRDANLPEHADALRSASSGGLTVVGILLPLSFLAIQIRTSSSSTTLSSTTLADFFLATAWLFLSLASGVWVLWISGIRGSTEDVAHRLDIGITYGAQLIFLLVGVWRLVWAVSSTITSLLT
ncbi:hypothetical protein [Streptomyces sp. NBC_00539]|uniref:hypothetical protein n=1 Tax=Streptomyces sp. NBC_00539 TaxID=2975770 RepID=UPI002E81DB13|nr:hypothetical protein [Streptomyces sp. NBC_00539]WUC65860.1 hypothetical protein OG861_17340 [Streptomyces sp. NBC_00539]